MMTNCDVAESEGTFTGGIVAIVDWIGTASKYISTIALVENLETK